MNSVLIMMWERQVKEYFRNKYRMLATLMLPFLFLIAFGFGISPMFEQTGNGNYIQYLLPGIIGMTILMGSTMNGMSLIWDKKFGFLKETLVAPVSRTSLLFGRCLGGATTSIFQGIIVLILGILLMGFQITDMLLLLIAIPFMFLIALFFNLLGTSFASVFDDMQSFPIIINFLVMPMFFLSGALFPINNFPDIIKFIASINPFTYCVELLRFGFGTVVEFNVIFSFSILISLIVFLGIIGTHLFNKIEP